MKEDNAQKVVAQKKYETKEVPQSAPLISPLFLLRGKTIVTKKLCSIFQKNPVIQSCE
jgi:hypothetical protein